MSAAFVIYPHQSGFSVCTTLNRDKWIRSAKLLLPLKHIIGLLFCDYKQPSCPECTQDCEFTFSFSDQLKASKGKFLRRG